MPKELTYLEAIREALAEEMRRDPKVFVLGEDVGEYGGAFGATQGLFAEFGELRVLDMPISESARRRSSSAPASGCARKTSSARSIAISAPS